MRQRFEKLDLSEVTQIDIKLADGLAYQMDVYEDARMEAIGNATRSYYRPFFDNKYFPAIGKMDTVLDVGAHVGFFTVPAIKSGAGIVAIEPNRENFLLLQSNALRYLLNGQFCDLRYACLSPVSGGSVIFYNSPYGTSGHSLRKKRGASRTFVTALNWKNIIRYSPTILKMDAEGIEHDVMLEPIPPGIRAMIIEFHFLNKEESKVTYERIRVRLIEQGYSVYMRPLVELPSKPWFERIIAWRPYHFE